jgi:hypothetical protein
VTTSEAFIFAHRPRAVMGAATTNKLAGSAIAFLVFAAAWPLVIAQQYPDLGFGVDTGVAQFTTSFVLTLAIAAMLPSRFEGARAVILYVIFFSYVLPTFVYCAMQSNHFSPTHPSTTPTALITFAAFAVVIGVSGLRMPVRPPVRINFFSAEVLTGVCVLGVLATFAITIGIGGLNFDLNRVYEFRADNLDRIPVLVQYIWPWVGRFLLILLFTHYLMVRRFVMAGLAFALGLLFVGFTAQKDLLWHFGMTVLLIPAMSGSLRLFYLTIIALMVVAIGFQLADYNNTNAISDLVLRRSMAGKAVQTDVYLDLFRDIGFNHWAYSKISFGLTTPTTSVPAPLLVGMALNKPGMNAGSGWIGSGYAEWGLMGVALCSVVTGAIISVANNISAHDKALVLSLGLFVAAGVSEADVFATLLNGGLAVGILLALGISSSFVSERARALHGGGGATV